MNDLRGESPPLAPARAAEARPSLDWRQAQLAPGEPIRNAIPVIDSEHQVALVVDSDARLLGKVTDSDLRRAMLEGVSQEAPVSSIMRSHGDAPWVRRLGQSRPQNATYDAEGRRAAERQDSDPDSKPNAERYPLRRHPIVDAEGRVVGMANADAPNPLEDRWMVIMAGGLGRRLRPLTEEIPKPMLPLGGRPMLERLVLTLKEQGFRRFYLSVHYLAEVIEDHFGDGSRFGVQVEYVREPEPRGTAGALALLPQRPQESFFVMNADVLTQVSFRHLFELHEEHSAEATLCVLEHGIPVPFGVVDLEGHGITAIREKPTARFFVSGGIYLLEPSALDLIPQDQPFDMPSLLDDLIQKERTTAAFPVREYWLDVGRPSDFHRAQGDWRRIFAKKGKTAADEGASFSSEQLVSSLETNTPETARSEHSSPPQGAVSPRPSIKPASDDLPASEREAS
ncbi:MAG: nucleotidyltransferase family protein [Acidobacteriota bacterium]